MKQPIKLDKVYRFGKEFYYPTDEWGPVLLQLTGTKTVLSSKHVDALRTLGLKLCIEVKEE